MTDTTAAAAAAAEAAVAAAMQRTDPTPPARRPAFDLGALDILSPSNEGKPLELVHPSGAPYRTSAGDVVHVRLRGRHSDAARAVLKACQDELAEVAATGREPAAELHREHDTRYLCAVTCGWNIELLDGAPFLVTAENVRKLWTDARFAHLRQRALNFVSADGAFLPMPT